ncbi:hypothetical protein [Acinetobacter sp. AS23]|uniref:hypothetical protein n=1 Tax=Acinetobacter sp. AS23 TaxID=2871688 RepID=UPI002026F58A|nr:hypothetical protein [Acinetobacter sp. AS23]URM39798.1 hypothetical protein K6I41_12555 [Acinetobacter sp. AS23]
MPNDQLVDVFSKLRELKEFDVKRSVETMNAFPSNEFSYDWKGIHLDEINAIIFIIDTYSDYYQDDYINQLIPRIKEITSTYNQILEIIEITDPDLQGNNLIDFEKKYNVLKDLTIKLYDLVKNPKFKNYIVYDLQDANFLKICTYIIYKYDLIFLENIIEEISRNENAALKLQIINKLINFNNINQPNKSNNIIIDLLKDYKIDNDNEIKRSKSELYNEKNNIEQYKNQALAEIETAKNALIITAFKEKVDSFKKPIRTLYILISLLFLTIIGSFLYRIFTINETSFNLAFFIYFVSFIASISSFLAYLIKQNNRLIQQQDYFHRCHVELSALPTYVYDIEKSKIDSLKIELAHKYFTGGTNTESSNNSEINITNENIKQILDLVKEATKKT